MLWTLLVPVKTADPKTRLASTLPSGTPGHHARLVAALRADALAAAGATPQVAHVVVITDAPGTDVVAEAPGSTLLVQHSRGLNGALRDGAAFAALHWPDDGVAALVGDLPALRADDLGAALDAAASLAVAFVADAEGTGTTLLTATPGTRLEPHFGPASAARHARTGIALTVGGPGLRRDVDTAADLVAAVRLGVGPATAAACDVVTCGSPGRSMM